MPRSNIEPMRTKARFDDEDFRGKNKKAKNKGSKRRKQDKRMNYSWEENNN